MRVTFRHKGIFISLTALFVITILVSAILIFRVGPFWPQTTSSLTPTSSFAAESTVNDSTSLANGLRLEASLNSTKFQVGQELNVSLSLFNTLPTDANISANSNWLFHGVPVAIWDPLCRGTYAFWPSPIEVIIVSGNLSVAQLATTPGNPKLPSCPPIDYGLVNDLTYKFEPQDSEVSLYLDADIQGPLTAGPFHISSHFAVGGVWNTTALLAQANESSPSLSRVPYEAVYVNSTNVPRYSSFEPGVYTVGVCDEWGQAVVLHFEVKATG